MRNSIGLMLMVAALCVFSAGRASAQENTVTITGTVSVDRDEDGAIIGVTLTVDDVDYTVVLNDAGKKLGEELDGEKAQVTGVVEKKNDQTLLTVKSYAKVEEKEEPEQEDEDKNADDDDDDDGGGDAEDLDEIM